MTDYKKCATPTCTIEAPVGYLSRDGRCADCEYQRFIDMKMEAKYRDKLLEQIHETAKISRML